MAGQRKETGPSLGQGAGGLSFKMLLWSPSCPDPGMQRHVWGWHWLNRGVGIQGAENRLVGGEGVWTPGFCDGPPGSHLPRSVPQFPCLSSREGHMPRDFVLPIARQVRASLGGLNASIP